MQVLNFHNKLTVSDIKRSLFVTDQLKILASTKKKPKKPKKQKTNENKNYAPSPKKTGRKK